MHDFEDPVDEMIHAAALYVARGDHDGARQLVRAALEELEGQEHDRAPELRRILADLE